MINVLKKGQAFSIKENVSVLHQWTSQWKHIQYWQCAINCSIAIENSYKNMQEIVRSFAQLGSFPETTALARNGEGYCLLGYDGM
jgi:hypothetical protein